MIALLIMTFASLAALMLIICISSACEMFTYDATPATLHVFLISAVLLALIIASAVGLYEGRMAPLVSPNLPAVNAESPVRP